MPAAVLFGGACSASARVDNRNAVCDADRGSYSLAHSGSHPTFRPGRGVEARPHLSGAGGSSDESQADRPVPLSLPEVLKGSVNGQLPANFDPAHPCADELPPTAHSHTFWPDGTFNSYDQDGNEVDRESYGSSTRAPSGWATWCP